MSQSSLSPTAKKRTYDGKIIEHPLTPIPLDKQNNESANYSANRSTSPAISTTGSTLTELTSMSVSEGAKPDLSKQETTKKRKLTFAEREVEKAVKKREKEEEKRLRDEEKKARNEEKEANRKLKEHEREVARQAKEQEKEVARQAKEQEREEKKKMKDAEKNEKEAEKAKKEEERIKKERSQMKIGSFFGQPALTGLTSTSPSSAGDECGSATSRRSSITSVDVDEQLHQSKTELTTNSEFSKWILPFFPHEYVELAPSNRYRTPHESQIFDGKGSIAQVEYSQVQQRIQYLRRCFNRSKQRIRPITKVKDIIMQMNETAETPINLTQNPGANSAIASLEDVPYKTLSFFQDVRPPYHGTYTKAISTNTSKKLARKPTWRGMPDTNYDYDSEAEWQEPEEGDVDLGEDDELSEDEEGEEEMDDFLDDEGDLNRRRLIVGEMEPVSSGLHWEGLTVDENFELSNYRLTVLHDSTTFPIDPYSTDHWSETKKETPKKSPGQLLVPTSTTGMQPPRVPLSTVNNPNLASVSPFKLAAKSDLKIGQDENTGSLPKSKGRVLNPNKPIKTIPDDVLPAFRDAVNGSDLNKVALTEILKKKFPKCSKDAIKDTLSTIAVRQGVKEVDKRWVIVD